MRDFFSLSACLTAAFLLFANPPLWADQSAFAAELERLATVCDSLKLDDAARVSRQWLRPARDDQRLLYLPVTDLGVALSSTYAQQWKQRFDAVRVRLADAAFSKARELASTDEPQAYRMLWECVRNNPEHDDAKRVLGGLLSAMKASPRVRSGAVLQPDLNWAPRSYLQATTAHFNLLSQASRQETEEYAQNLEKFYALWTQAFCELWLKPGELAEALAKRRPIQYETQRQRFNTVLLPDRKAYLELLHQSESQVGVSVGYYSIQAQKSFFYVDPAIQVTMKHELTHQLIAEASYLSTVESVGASHSVWLVEGIAIYMESLADHGTYWTLGGWDSPRLQIARYRGVRNGDWESLSSFASGGLNDWKVNPNIAKLYTHAAGITHVVLDGGLGKEAPGKLMKALAGVYEGHDSSSSVLQELGSSNDEARERYQDALIVTDHHVVQLARANAKPAELVLCGSRLEEASWYLLVEQSELTWLNLAFSNISPAHTLKWLGGANQLQRLSLEGCSVDASVMKAIRQLADLEELDLSDCQVDDSLLAELAGHPKLQTLWLTRTQVTASGLPTLRSLPKLSQCDLSETKIPPDQQSKFR